MNKNAIRRFAIYAREELIKRVTIQAATYGVTGKDDDAGAVNAGDRVFSPEEREWRGQLVRRIRRDGFEQVMEEVAYTWFNRFCALRFMEVNGYLPSRVRVFTDEANAFRPQMLAEALHLELEGLDRERVLDLKGKNDDEALYRYLLITQCNALAGVLPGLFQRLDAETSLLCPDNLLHEDSVLAHLVADIPEEDWRDQVQVIGWLYQYYNAVPKDMVFAALKKNIKVSKENIPAATQLFTPDWIVRYMVENSLGRLWLEGHPDAALRAGWKYYLDEAEQEPAVAAELAKLRAGRAALRPEEIRCIDPCMGSGHILVYMFDVLMQIYRACGYPDREAVQSIVQNNLYGLDIDERAAQLAYFAVMMKAVQYDRRFLRRRDNDGNSNVPQPHIYAIMESNGLDAYTRDYFVNGNAKLQESVNSIITDLWDAKEYGSIINVTLVDFAMLYARFDEICEDISFSRETVLKELLPLVQVAEALARQYDVVVTNPPYMGNAGFSLKLSEYAKENYVDSKNDLYSIMIEKCRKMTADKKYSAMITMQSWMNAPTFKSLRRSLFYKCCFTSVINMGSRAFEDISGEKVKNVAFVSLNATLSEWKPLFVDLTGIAGENEKRLLFLKHDNEYAFSKQSDFFKHEQCLVIYRTKHIEDIYSPELKISDCAKVKRCIATGNDELFIRNWSELARFKISPIINKEESAKWFFVANGGERKRWYGNILNVLNWEHNGESLREYNDRTKKSTLRNVEYMFREGLTYTYTSMGSGVFNARILMPGMASIGVGPVIIDCHNNLFMLAFVNSAVFRWFWDTMFGKVSTFETGNVGNISYKEGNTTLVCDISKECVALARQDWDSCETSWDFQRHPLLQYAAFTPQQVAKEEASGYLPLNGAADAYAQWKAACETRFQQLKANEEELNRIFIDIYGLQDELTPEVADRDVTVHRVFDTKEDVPESMKGSNYVRTKRDEVVSLISYAVGCMFGRYSLDVDGLVYAGGVFSDQWVVVSGQLVNRKVVEECVGKELSRAFGMAEVDVAGGGDLPAGETAAERGVICLIRPDEKGGRVGPLQYRRGTSKKLYEGICELSLDRPGFSGGIGNTVYDLCSPEILDAITNRSGDALVRRGWADAERFDWEAVHQSLTTSHRPLPTDHQPLTTTHFPPDRDGILPICDDEYFEDDIVGMFARFLEAAYGKQTLEDNLRFVAEALGGSGAPREVIRAYFLNDFFTDHCKTYQKRPIYWLFDSGKKNGFKALIYMHRYAPDTIARIRTDYLHEQQSRYRTAIAGVETRLRAAEGAERVRLSKQLEKLQAQAEEARLYEEKIHHLADQMIAIDLDDGVKVNYAKFADVLAKIK